jgi:hypothetical protein
VKKSSISNLVMSELLKFEEKKARSGAATQREIKTGLIYDSDGPSLKTYLP